jgi:hypothetical protein
MSTLAIHSHFYVLNSKQVIIKQFSSCASFLLVWSKSIIQGSDLINKSKYQFSPELANIIYQEFV